MYLRKLEKKDAPFMLEWMHDEFVTKDLKANFHTKTIDDCILFIENSIEDSNNLNLAIVNEEDEYMGTVSLKNINRSQNYAEFAITVRKSAMGNGYASFGMKEILKKGYEELNISTIYWCVSSHNIRANNFYKKNHYQQTEYIPQALVEEYDSVPLLIWYVDNRN